MADIKQFYNLDFDDLKTQFKSFIESETEFQDYNFEGSALSQMVDIITFGIQYQNMYLNMATNELFMDTAQIDTNIFKIANTLNYIPKRKSAAYVWADLQRNNDIENGEDWADAENSTPPSDWDLATGVTDGVFTIVDDSSTDSDRDTTLEIEQDTSGAKLISQSFATTIGKNYTFSVYYKSSSSQSARMMVGWDTDISGDYLDNSLDSSDEWLQLVFDFTASTATTYFTLGAGDDAIGESVYFDECRLTQNLSITIPKYSTFAMGSLEITNIEDIVINSNDTQAIRLYEGEITTETWVSDGSTFQEYTLAYRDDVDNTQLNVYVDAADGTGGFIASTTAWINVNIETFELNDDGYYIQHFDELTIKFDDGQRFAIPAVNEQVRVIYLKTQGATVNGDAAAISIDTSVTNYDELTISRTSVMANGTDEESTDAIRTNAPLYYTTQNRAVTQDDHNILVKRYSGYDAFFDAYLWGGELEFVEEVAMTDYPYFYKRIVEWFSNKEFPNVDVGHVYVTALNDDFSYLDDTEISDLITFMDVTKIIAIFYRFLQPQIVHFLPTVNIKYESVLNLDTDDIATQIDEYLDDNLEGFNKAFHLSNLIKFVDTIDEVVETSITYTNYVTVKDSGYVAVRLWNEVVPGSIYGMVNGFALTDDGAGNLVWNGTNVGTISYTSTSYTTEPLSGLTGGFMIINQDDNVSFGLPDDSTYDLEFEYASDRTVQLNRESFMMFDPIILVAEVYEETE